MSISLVMYPENTVRLWAVNRLEVPLFLNIHDSYIFKVFFFRVTYYVCSRERMSGEYCLNNTIYFAVSLQFYI
jgi:hypothetical protein